MDYHHSGSGRQSVKPVREDTNLKHAIAGVMLAMIGAGAATAAEPGVSVAEAAFVRTEHGNSGFLVRGSGALGRLFTIEGAYERTDFFHHDLHQLSLGVGARWSLNDNVQLFGSVTGEAVHSPTGGDLAEDEFTHTSVGIRAGVRDHISERLELAASIKYDGITKRIQPSIGGRYHFTHRLAAGVDFTDEFYGTRWMAVLRLDFGAR